MKSKDFLTITFLTIIAGLIGLLMNSMIFASKNSLTTKVEVVQPISGSFDFADKSYFKGNPLNPTRTITIDNNNTTQPLNKE